LEKQTQKIYRRRYKKRKRKWGKCSCNV